MIPPPSSSRCVTPIRLPAIDIGQASAWLLAGLFLALGIVGHDPWKPDEGYVFGVILDGLRSGQWTVPSLAGEPFLEKPPLYYFVGSVCARLTAPLFAPHDGARLASLLFNGITLVFVALSARRVWGRGSAVSGALLLAGSLGFVLVARSMLPDLAMLSGMAMAFHGLLRATDDDRSPGILLGTGFGIAFLSKGLIGPGMLIVAMAFLALWSPVADRPRLWRTCVIAGIAALPWCLVWPMLLLHADPAAFHVWIWDNNIGRFTGASVNSLGAAAPPGFWWYTLPWYALPALPLALLALRAGFRPRDPWAIAVCVATLGGVMTVLLLSASARENYALPVLVPMAVLAAGGLRALGTAADRRLAGIVFGAFAAIAVWLTLLWLFRAESRLHVPGLALLARHVPVETELPGLHWPRFLGLVGSVAALGVLAATSARSVRHWFPVAWIAGATLVLGAAFTLWLPWLEASKSYRAPIAAMQARLPSEFDCIASEALGESERAMLDYVAGIRTLRREVHPDAPCSLLLVQMRSVSDAAQPVPAGWVELWRGRRLAVPYDELRLLRRTPAVTDPPSLSRAPTPR